MPNTFASLEVPTSDQFTGSAFDVRESGSEKTFVFDGAVRPGGRYIVEGTADGGDTWDILIGRDGTQVFFAADNAGIKTVEAVVSHIRVRSERNGVVTVPPSITIGAPPAQGTNLFRVLPVPPANGLGDVVDLGDSAGPLKTLILRRGGGVPLPSGSRYSVLASMDGTRFDEVALFTADRQGTRTLDVLCRFLRVQREAGGTVPVISVGSEGLPRIDDRCPVESLSLQDEKTAGVQALVAEWMVDFDTLAGVGDTLGAVLSGIGRVQEASQAYRLRLVVGGNLGRVDGQVIGQVLESPGDVMEHAVSIRENLSRPAGRLPVKLLLGSDVANPDAAHLRGVLCQFTCPCPRLVARAMGRCLCRRR